MSKKKTFSDQISVDQIKAYKDEKIESLVNISYDEARQLDDLDLVYWGYIKDLLPSSSSMEYLGEVQELPSVDQGDNGTVARIGKVLYIVDNGSWVDFDLSSFYYYGAYIKASPSIGNYTDDFLIFHNQSEGKWFFASKEDNDRSFVNARIYLSKNKTHYDLGSISEVNNGYELFEIDVSGGLIPDDITHIQVWFSPSYPITERESWTPGQSQIFTTITKFKDETLLVFANGQLLSEEQYNADGENKEVEILEILEENPERITLKYYPK